MVFSICIIDRNEDILRVVKDKRFEVPEDKIEAVNDHMYKYVNKQLEQVHANLNFRKKLKSLLLISNCWCEELIDYYPDMDGLIETPLLNKVAKYCIEFGCISVMYEIIMHIYKVCKNELEASDFDKEILVSTLSRNNTVKFCLTCVRNDGM